MCGTLLTVGSEFESREAYSDQALCVGTCFADHARDTKSERLSLVGLQLQVADVLA